MSITLPPLPEPAFSLRWERGEYKVSPPMDDCDCYTADQLRARDLEIVRLALEAAAKVCEETYPERVGGQDVVLPCYDTPTECAAAIRALKEQTARRRQLRTQ